MNCTVHVRPDGCDVWVGTQVIHRAQGDGRRGHRPAARKGPGAQSPARRRFGRRLEVDGVTQAVQIARQVEGPVKVIWTREEDIQHDVYRPYYYDHLAAGLDGTGAPTAFSHRVTGSSILARWAPPAFKDGIDGDARRGRRRPYSFPNMLVDYVRQEPPAGLTTTWWRGVGMTHKRLHGGRLHRRAGGRRSRTRSKYRRALLGKAPRARAVLDLAAEKAGWDRPMPAEAGAGCRSSSVSAATWRRSPRSRSAAMAACG